MRPDAQMDVGTRRPISSEARSPVWTASAISA